MVHRANETETTVRNSLDVMGMVVTEIDHIPALLSGMETVSGLIVKTVRWGGIADLADVRSGDVISAVNGIPVSTVNDLKLVLEAFNESKPFRFLLRRIGEWRYLALSCDTIEMTDGPAIGSKTVRAWLETSCQHRDN